MFVGEEGEASNIAKFVTIPSCLGQKPYGLRHHKVSVASQFLLTRGKIILFHTEAVAVIVFDRSVYRFYCTI
jgi:hypothetical protein